MNTGPSTWKLVLAGFVIFALGAGAFAAYGGLASSGSPKQRMVAWVKASGLGASTGTLQTDDSNVTLVVKDHDGIGTVHEICGVLSVDSLSANQELPSPNPTVTNDLTNAYQLEYQAANDCYNGGVTGTALLNRSARERREARVSLSNALTLVNRIIGSTVSTTTTTSPDSGSIFG